MSSDGGTHDRAAHPDPGRAGAPCAEPRRRAPGAPDGSGPDILAPAPEPAPTRAAPASPASAQRATDPARAPERIRFGLAAKLGLLIAVAALVSAQAVGTFVVRGYETELTKHEDALLAEQERREADVLRLSVRQMVGDVRFLALTPPVTGIPRARAHGGADPLDGSTEALWRTRLAQIFTALAASRPAYIQIRYIEAADPGREIVRVDQDRAGITVVPRAALQPKGDRPYVQNALALGRVYLSPVELNRERGRVAPDHTPVLRAATAVKGPDGTVFGVVVINMDFRPVLDRLAAVAPKGTTVYVTNEDGEFLLHPDPSRAFTFDFGRSDRIQGRFPALAGLFAPGAPDAFAARIDEGPGPRTILRLVRIHFHPDDPARFLALALAAPEDRFMADQVAMRYRAIGTVMVLTLILAVGTFLIGLRLILPLRRITDAVAAFPQFTQVPLPVHSKDELGTLARTFVRIRAERLADEARLKAAMDELARSNAELDDFAYIASHDLKEPLRGIHNYAGFLLEDYADRLDDAGRDKLHTLTRLARRLESLIDSLLTFSRVGRTAPAFEPVDLDAVLADVLASIQVFLQERGVAVRVPKPLPTVLCDRDRIGEVFLNLVTNAAKYNDKPDKWVEVGWAPGPGGPTFHVTDNGIGIPTKHLDAVFRIFKRLHARDAFGGGTGAGLTIARKIVERHGGRLTVASEPGVGTTFQFTLPGATP